MQCCSGCHALLYCCRPSRSWLPCSAIWVSQVQTWLWCPQHSPVLTVVMCCVAMLTQTISCLAHVTCCLGVSDPHLVVVPHTTPACAIVELHPVHLVSVLRCAVLVRLRTISRPAHHTWLLGVSGPHLVVVPVVEPAVSAHLPLPSAYLAQHLCCAVVCFHCAALLQIPPLSAHIKWGVGISAAHLVVAPIFINIELSVPSITSLRLSC